MPASVTLTVVSGPGSGQEIVFEERAQCMIGRDPKCTLRLDDPRNPPQVSRQHCLLDIIPPDVRIRDLGSQNGTFVNGRLIGKRGDAGPAAEVDLHDGDTLGVADVVLRVDTHPVLCSTCRSEVPREERDRYPTPDGKPVCGTCFQQGATGVLPVPGTRDRPDQAVEQLLTLARTGRGVLPLRDYVIERKLGKGGMGAVYLACHVPTRRRVALKVMLPHIAVDERCRERFLREIDNTRALQHPNVVELFDAGCEQGTFFFTLEYCEGGSLDQLLKQRGSLPVAEAVAILFQVLDALAYAHQAEVSNVRLADGTCRPGSGLVHRDLKPSNLLLTGSGPAPVVKIADFGLAKAFDLAGLSGHTVSGERMGTPEFFPRQQLFNFMMAQPEVDVWAAAAVLYNLLTDTFPRDFNPGCDRLLVVLEQDPVPILQRNPGLPPRLAELIDHALTEEPEIPFKSAADFQRALEAVL
jgi:eukaryotic-like serine/threonine-protein kinase